MTQIFNSKRARQSELLQLLLLDTLYSLSGTGRLIFHGGTALRWIHGGPRFSEDLDFVTGATIKEVGLLWERSRPKMVLACAAQFGAGLLEQQIKSSRKEAFKAFCIYRPQNQRERVAVKLEVERLSGDRLPANEPHILRDLSAVSGLVAAGQLILPYTSSIVIAETPLEILSDKIRALYERPFLKGRDIFDLWWLIKHRRLTPNWSSVRKKLEMYRTNFRAARRPDFFQSRDSRPAIREALDADLSRFIPPNILAVYRTDGFKDFIDTTYKVTARLLGQGLEEYLDAHRL